MTDLKERDAVGLALPTGPPIPISTRASGGWKSRLNYWTVWVVIWIGAFSLGVYSGIKYADPHEATRQQAWALATDVHKACVIAFVDPLPKRGENVFKAMAKCQYLSDLVLERVYGEGAILSKKFKAARRLARPAY